MKLQRYLVGRMLAAVAVSWAVLWGLLWAVSWMEGVGHLANQAHGARDAALLALLASADLAWQVLPVAMVVGLAFATTQLARDGELLGLWASGYAPVRLAAPLLATAAALAGLGTLLAQLALPPLAQRHAALQRTLRGHNPAAVRAFDRQEQWFRTGDYVLYVPRPESDDATTLARPEVFALRQHRLLAWTQAEALRFVAPTGSGGAGAWQLQAPVTVWLARDAAQPADFAAAQAAALAALPAQLPATHGHPKWQPAGRLQQLIARRERAGIVSAVHRLEAAGRYAHPALGWASSLVLLPWALLPSRRRRLMTMLGAVTVGLAGVLALSQLMRLLANAGVLSATAASGWTVAAVVAAAPFSARRAAKATFG